MIHFYFYVDGSLAILVSAGLKPPAVQAQINDKLQMSASKSRTRSSEVAKRRNLKRADYPPDIVNLVMKLRAASYKMGGTDLPYLFGQLDKDKSGSLDVDEFKLTLRR